MSKIRLFIDGHAGTTGLRIRDWLVDREDLELVTLTDEKRKDPEARREMILDSDLAVLCLPDAAAQEAARWAEESTSSVRLLDSSTAHRVASDWAYGLPELSPDQRDLIRSAKRVANPGCYPTAFLLSVRPLVDADLLDPQAALSIHALSGFSGGGRPLIEKWEDPANGLANLPFEAPYAPDRVHKHVPEMQAYSGLARPPFFMPAVGPFECGMRVQIPLHAGLLKPKTTAQRMFESLSERYQDEPCIKVHASPSPDSSHERSFDPQKCNNTNRVEIHVVENPAGHVLLVTILDNLGKGAAGAAIQNLNLMLGCDEMLGLGV